MTAERSLALGALSHCASLRVSLSEVAQVSAGRSRRKESVAARPRVRGGLGCPVAHPEGPRRNRPLKKKEKMKLETLAG
jgi:hypothetical protein